MSETTVTVGCLMTKGDYLSVVSDSPDEVFVEIMDSYADEAPYPRMVLLDEHRARTVAAALLAFADGEVK